jgi:membrane-associated phospholipid phosphatase
LDGASSVIDVHSTRRPAARTALQGALACFVALVAVGLGAAFVPAVRDVDEAAAGGFIAAAGTGLGALTARVARLADPAPYLLMGLALVAVALVRGRVARAAAVAVLLVATGATTQALKTSLGHPRAGDILGVEMGSWPSGHSTAAMTIALCAVLVAPRALRGAVAAVGAAYALAVGLGVLVMEWHLATDVAGGYLVAMAWTLLAVAVLRRVERPVAVLRRVERPAFATVARPAGQWALIAVAALVGVAAARVDAGSLADFAIQHTWATATAAGLCVLAAALAALLAATLRR